MSIEFIFTPGRFMRYVYYNILTFYDFWSIYATSDIDQN